MAASEILRELIVKLSLKDEATPHLDKFTKEIDASFKKIVNLKNVLIGGALAAVGSFLVDAADKFQKFGRSVEQTGTIMKATEKQVRDTTFRLMEMSKTSIFTKEQLGGALREIAEQGITAANAMQVLQASQKIASSSGDDLNSVTEVNAKLLEKFGVTGEEAEEVLNLIANAAQAAGIDYLDFANVLLELSDDAIKSGTSLEELAEGLAQAKIISGSTVGAVDLVSKALKSIQKNADDGGKSLRALIAAFPGIQIKPGETTFADVLKQAADILPTLTPEQIAKIRDNLAVLDEPNLITILDRIPQMDFSKQVTQLSALRELVEKTLAGEVGGPEGETKLTTGERLAKGVDVLFEGTFGAIFHAADELFASFTKGQVPFLRKGGEPVGLNLDLSGPLFKRIEEEVTERDKLIEAAQGTTESLEELKEAADETAHGSGLVELKEKIDSTTESVKKFEEKITSTAVEVESSVGSLKLELGELANNSTRLNSAFESVISALEEKEQRLRRFGSSIRRDFRKEAR